MPVSSRSVTLAGSRASRIMLAAIAARVAAIHWPSCSAPACSFWTLSSATTAAASGGEVMMSFIGASPVGKGVVSAVAAVSAAAAWKNRAAGTAGLKTISADWMLWKPVMACGAPAVDLATVG